MGPVHRRLWSHVFRGDDAVDPRSRRSRRANLGGDDDDTPVDAAWIVSRVHRSVPAIGRRRLETLLFAQRNLAEAPQDEEAGLASALRGFVSFPALGLALERIGTTSPALLTRAAARAQSLNELRDEEARRTSITLFQSSLGIVTRVAENKGLPSDDLSRVVASLISIDVAPETYGARIGTWLRNELAATLNVSVDSPDSLEDGLLLAMSGPVADKESDTIAPIVQWEGRAYRVDPTAAEQQRLRHVRERQGGMTLEAAMDGLHDPADTRAGKGGRGRADRALADVLTSILYAAYLGEPDGPALSGGNVASRHDLALTPTIPPRPIGAWRLPGEDFRTRSGWHVSGSLLGLDTALARLALRRLDSSAMPTESRLSTADRQTAALTVALLNPHHLTDAGRDQIAAALGRGRARLASLRPNRDEMERVAKAAGLSEWRREALAWTLTQDPGRTSSALSLVELLWLGAPRPSAAAPLDPWGAATLPLTGCPCLQMPRANAWEESRRQAGTRRHGDTRCRCVAPRGGSAGNAQAPGIACAGNCRPRDARRAGRRASGVFRRLVWFYKSGSGAARGEVGRLHRCVDRCGPAHPRASNRSLARTTMTLRGDVSLAVAIAAVLAIPPTASTSRSGSDTSHLGADRGDLR